MPNCVFDSRKADAATQGMGLAWLPYWLVRERLGTGALVGLFKGQPEFLYDCHALWPVSPRMPPKLRAAVDVLAAALPKLMT